MVLRKSYAGVEATHVRSYELRESHDEATQKTTQKHVMSWESYAATQYRRFFLKGNRKKEDYIA